MKGLPNIGNTCYFNTALQCLFQVPPLSNYFIKLLGPEGDEFTQEYRRLVRQYWSDDTGTIDPSRLLQCVQSRFKQFQGRDQQDAQEVIMCMFDMFEKTLVKYIFRGTTIQETICNSGRSHLIEEFYSIVLYPSASCSVTEAIEKYQNFSTIKDYVDAKGTKHDVAVSRTLFWELPRIFIVSFQNRQRIKISETLNFQSWLHTDAPKNQVTQKTLFALILHQGSQYGGHYSSFTNHCGTWYYKDDLNVDMISPPEEEYYYLAMYK